MKLKKSQQTSTVTSANGMGLQKKNVKSLEAVVVAAAAAVQPKNEGFQLLPVKYSAESSVVRHVFMKQLSLLYHKIVDEQKPADRTLFMINVPPFVTEHHIRYLFEKRCGKITRIFLQEKPSLSSNATRKQESKFIDETEDVDESSKVNSVNTLFHPDGEEKMCYKVCYVVFAKPLGLTNALAMTSPDGNVTPDQAFVLKPTKAEIEQSTDLQPQHFYTGIRLWKQQYNQSVVTPWQAKQVAQSYIEHVRNRIEKEESHKQSIIDAGPDKDGWTVVDKKRDRNALVINSKQFEQKLVNVYVDRARKRKKEEEIFEQSVRQEMLTSGKKKKKNFNNMFD